MNTVGKIALLVASLAALSSCGSVGSCVTGQSVACACSGGATGTQVCSAQGIFEACLCADAGVATDGGVCGDHVCTMTAGENCQSCPQDCGECPKCNYAPSCSDAVGVPSMPQHRSDLDTGSGIVPGIPPDAGTAGVQNCDTPELRIRLQAIRTDKGGGEIYCIVNASDGTTSEVAITPKTGNLGDGQTYSFPPEVGLFWGSKALASTRNNLTITYDCVIVKSDTWAKVFAAIQSAAGMNANGGLYGWAFGIAGTAAAAAAAALMAAAGDDHKFNAQQTIDKSAFLDLTNGRQWIIHENGGSLGSRWDWTLTVESWGCADAKPTPQ